MSHASPDPFALAGGPVTVILLHGFTGSPAEMRLLAYALNAQGYGVETPLLAGHGTRLDDLMKIEPHQWLEQIDALVQRLHDHGQRVVVAGLSLGSILALQAGLRHPEVEAVMAYSPPIISGDPRVLIESLQRACAGLDPGDATSVGGTAATAARGGQPQGSRDHRTWRGMAQTSRGLSACCSALA